MILSYWLNNSRSVTTVPVRAQTFIAKNDELSTEGNMKRGNESKTVIILHTAYNVSLSTCLQNPAEMKGFTQ